MIESGTKSTVTKSDKNIALVIAIITQTPAIILQYFNENKNGTKEISDNTITNKGDKYAEGNEENRLGANQIQTGMASIHVIKKKNLYAFLNFVRITGR